MDYHLAWYKCCPHWDDEQWHWTGSITQRSKSHEIFKCQSTHTRVRAINSSYIYQVWSQYVSLNWNSNLFLVTVPLTQEGRKAIHQSSAYCPIFLVWSHYVNPYLRYSVPVLSIFLFLIAVTLIPWAPNTIQWKSSINSPYILSLVKVCQP